MTTTGRAMPPLQADERTTLESWLDFYRATLAHKCDGLGDEQLRTASAPPSPLTLLGLVQHMAEVERNWFRRVLEGEEAPPLYYSDTDPDGDFDNVDDADPEEALAAWRAECDRSRSLAAARASLDDVGRALRQGQQVSLRWILIHMVEEYARHNGHADLLRERIDGVVGD